MPVSRRWVLAMLLAWATLPGFAAPLPLPARDDEVVEVLPAVTRSRPALATAAPRGIGLLPDPSAAGQQAREAITTARQTGDARYWGRAQTVLAPWWDRPDAPVDLLVLKATVLQGRHAFDEAHTVLTALLPRAPQDPQIWLTLATLERLRARYAQALLACDAVAKSGQVFYAEACRLETLSMQGRHAQARDGFQALLRQRGGAAAQSSWVLSLLAESEERAGRDAAAREAYGRSLAAEADLYTAIAYSDLLLRVGDLPAARAALARLPQTDAVLLRQAVVLRRLKDPQWQALREELHARASALDRRGDDLTLHDRELALVALWLDDTPARALELAQRNLTLQREPLDWWIALESARLARDAEASRTLQQRVLATGLHDERLRRIQRASR